MGQGPPVDLMDERALLYFRGDAIYCAADFGKPAVLVHIHHVQFTTTILYTAINVPYGTLSTM